MKRTSRHYVIGFSTDKGSSAPFTAAQRALATRIEQHDRDLFADVHRDHDPKANLVCRKFLPGEHELQQAMAAPIRPHHVVMALVLDKSGYIDRKPITAARLAEIGALIDDPP